PLAATLSRWLADDQRRAAVAKRAPAFAREHYDWQRITERWLRHYDALAVARQGQSASGSLSS
ncbi:MAG: glycosyltransferase, partial [Phycisphaeraceae bacterium]